MSNSQSDHVHFNLLKRDENRRQSRAGKCKIHSASESKVFLQIILVVAASVDIKLGTFSVQHTKIIKYYHYEIKNWDSFGLMYFDGLQKMQWTIVSSWSG